MTRKIEAVLFDWDLTLGRALGDISFEERLSKLFNREGFFHDPQEIGKAISTRDQHIEDGTLIGNSEPQTKEDIIVFYQQTLQLLGHKNVTRATAEQLRASYATLPFILYDDALPALETLVRKGFKVGIITNHSPKVEAIIVDLVGEYIPQERITISDMVGAYKPDGEIFRVGARRVGTMTHSCAYVGDNLLADAIAALTNGEYAKSLWLNRNGKRPSVELPLGVIEVSNLTDVAVAVQSYIQ